MLTTQTLHVPSSPPVTSKELPSAIARQVIAPRCPPVPHPPSGNFTVETWCSRTTWSQYPQLIIDSELASEAECTPKHECTLPIIRAGPKGVISRCELAIGSPPLAKDALADTLLMCNNRDGREWVLDRPRVKGSPRPSGSPLQVHVVTRSEASTHTRRSSVQYTRSTAAPKVFRGLCVGENTCGSPRSTHQKEGVIRGMEWTTRCR